jgi:K+-transporting ATPase KdpF subunit
LGARNVSARRRIDAALLHVSDRLREHLGVNAMIYFTAAVCVFLFVYLTVALVRPEWF